MLNIIQHFFMVFTFIYNNLPESTDAATFALLWGGGLAGSTY